MSAKNCFYLLLLCTLSMVSGCDKGGGELEAVKAKNTELETTLKTLSTQVRTLNDEHVQMKKVVSDMTDTVLLQNANVEKLDANLKQANERIASLSQRVASGSKSHSSPQKPTPSSSTGKSTSKHGSKPSTKKH